MQEDDEMNKQDTQTKFEAICFMHEMPQETQEDYMDTYAEEPKLKPKKKNNWISEAALMSWGY